MEGGWVLGLQILGFGLCIGLHRDMGRSWTQEKAFRSRAVCFRGRRKGCAEAEGFSFSGVPVAVLACVF